MAGDDTNAYSIIKENMQKSIGNAKCMHGWVFLFLKIENTKTGLFPTIGKKTTAEQTRNRGNRRIAPLLAPGFFKSIIATNVAGPLYTAAESVILRSMAEDKDSQPTIEMPSKQSVKGRWKDSVAPKRASKSTGFRSVEGMPGLNLIPAESVRSSKARAFQLQEFERLRNT